MKFIWWMYTESHHYPKQYAVHFHHPRSLPHAPDYSTSPPHCLPGKPLSDSYQPLQAFFFKQAFLKVYTVMPKMAFSTEQLSCCLSFFLSFLHFFSFIFISWRLITLQYCSGFCHTLTWISHGFTCVPHPDPPSLLLSFDLPTPLAVTCLTSPCRHLNLWSSLSAPPRASQVYILWV